MIAQARRPFISVPPQVATPTPSPPAPPFCLTAQTDDIRRYGLVLAAGYAERHGGPITPSAIPRTPPPFIARRESESPYIGFVFMSPTTGEHVNPVVQQRGLNVSRQSDFPIPPGSSITCRGWINSLPVNTSPVLFSLETFRQPYAGSSKLYFGHVPAKSIVPYAPLPLSVFRSEPPHPGSVSFRVGSGDLNPTAPGRILAAFTSDVRVLIGGSVKISVQKTNTLIQTPPTIIARQSSPLPTNQGSVFYRHASIDNGDQKRIPLIVRESARPYPEGSSWNRHSGPDNGLLYVPLLMVREFPAQPYPGLALIRASQSLSTIGTPILFEFTLDFTYTVDFDVDLV